MFAGSGADGKPAPGAVWGRQHQVSGRLSVHALPHRPSDAAQVKAEPPSLSLSPKQAFHSFFLFAREHGFSFVRLDGTMSQKKRTQIIQEFQSSAADSPKVMLLSLKAGGVGLNLTAASRVFLMDPVRAHFCSKRTDSDLEMPRAFWFQQIILRKETKSYKRMWDTTTGHRTSVWLVFLIN